MKLDASMELARSGKLYPSTILHGGAPEDRLTAAVELARAVLCERPAEDRPCGRCSHCRRIGWPDGEEIFHPDFAVLVQDLKTATSVEATRRFVGGAHYAPYEARGQVFAIAAAETLSGEAANALLKTLEEPGERWPRHFLLLAPSQFDLLPTLRSRSWSVYLGAGAEADADAVDLLVDRLVDLLEDASPSSRGLRRIQMAEALLDAGEFKDPRATAGWSLGAAALRRAALEVPAPDLRRRTLALAEALLAAPPLRLRGISAERIVHGLVARHLGSGRSVPTEVSLV